MAAKIFSLSSTKIAKYEYTGEGIPLSQEHGIVKEANFSYSLLEKALEKTKTERTEKHFVSQTLWFIGKRCYLNNRK